MVVRVPIFTSPLRMQICGYNQSCMHIYIIYIYNTHVVYILNGFRMQVNAQLHADTILCLFIGQV